MGKQAAAGKKENRPKGFYINKTGFTSDQSICKAGVLMADKTACKDVP